MSRLLDKIYHISPALVQNIAVSLYGYKVYRREYGGQFERLLEEYEKQQWFSPGELNAFQNDKLRTLIKHSYRHVPYYRQIMDERNLTPADITTVDDLAKLPILTRDIVKKNLSRLMATNIRRSHIYAGHTSGTTGSPLKLFWDNQICLIKNVVDWRQKKWAGLKLGDRIAFFLARMVVPIERKKPPFWRHNWVLNHLFCSSFHMSQENLSAYLKKLNSFRPRAIEGYPSTIFILAGHLLSMNKTFPLKAILTSSEPLMPHQRETIEKAFDCKVFDFYGLAERVAFATECEYHKGKHLNTDFGVVEVLKKNHEPTPHGQMGRIVATGLHNLAMPLIRYQTSDVTALMPDSCDCGRGFPLIENITTKDEDIITTKDGRYLSSSILNAVTHHLTSIAESQIIQDDLEHVRMKIVRRPDYGEKDTHFILRELGKVLGDEMMIDLEFVDNIPRTKAGKFRWVISKVPLEF